MYKLKARERNNFRRFQLKFHHTGLFSLLLGAMLRPNSRGAVFPRPEQMVAASKNALTWLAHRAGTVARFFCSINKNVREFVAVYERLRTSARTRKTAEK